MEGIGNLKYKSQYSNAEFLAFHDAVLKCANIATPEALSCTPKMLKTYAETVAELQKLVHHDSKSQLSGEISEFDDSRDDCATTIYALIEAYAYSPIAAMAQAGEKLQEATRLYRLVARSALAAETVELKGLLEILKQPELKNEIAAIEHLGELIAELETANNKVEDLMNARSGEKVEKALKKEKRSAADAAYTAIALRASASKVILPSDAVDAFVTEVNNLIERTEKVYKQRIAVQRANEAKKKAAEKQNENEQE